MSKVEQPSEQKKTEEIRVNIQEGMTLGEASDISSMTLLRRQLETENTEEEESRGEVK